MKRPEADHVRRRPADPAAPAAGAEADGSERDRGPKGIVKGVWREFQANDSLSVAGSIAYFAFLSLPPSILVLFALTGFFGGDEVAQWVMDHLATVLPEESAELVEGFVESVVHTQAPGPFSIGLLLALWAGSNVFMAVARALDISYGIEDTRGFVKQRALAIGVMILFVLLFLSASAALIAGPQIAAALDPFGVVGQLWSVLHWPLAFLVVTAAFWLVYYILPARDQKPANRMILIGAFVSAIIWVLATVGFRLYVANIGGYDEVYGFLGAFIILLLWLYITGVVLLLGGHLAAELERQSRRG
jgi:membrane protein